jgi:hypothetical protein
VDLIGGDYRIKDVNEAFDSRLMRREAALKLSFIQDFLSYDQKSIFLSAIQIMKANKNTSTVVPNVKTLTVDCTTMC